MPDYGDTNPDTGRTSARTDFEGSPDPNAPSVANGQITPDQWAEYQKKRRRDALLGILATIGGTSALGAVGGAVSGAGPAGGYASVPGATSGAPITAASQGAAYGIPTVSGGMGAGVAGAAGATGAGAGLAGNVGAKTIGGLTAQDLLSLGTGLTGLIGGAVTNKSNNPTTATTDPQLAELLALMSGRLKKSEPLHDSVLSMANGLLPTQYQNGGKG